MLGIFDKIISGFAALVVSNYIEANIKNNREYYTYDYQTVGNGASINYLVRTNGFKWIDIKNRIIKTNSQDVLIEVIEAPSVGTIGDLLPVRSWNRPAALAVGARTPELKVYKNTASVTGGTVIDTDYSFGVGSGTGKSAGISDQGTERILEINTDYVLRITNNGNSGTIYTRFDWYEGRLNPDPDVLIANEAH